MDGVAQTCDVATSLSFQLFILPTAAVGIVLGALGIWLYFRHAPWNQYVKRKAFSAQNLFYGLVPAYKARHRIIRVPVPTPGTDPTLPVPQT